MMTIVVRGDNVRTKGITTHDRKMIDDDDDDDD